MRRLKTGFQCQERHEEIYRYNRELKPAVVKSINITDREHYTRLATENPGVELVYRQYVESQPYDDPENQAVVFAQTIYGKIGHIPEITYIEDYNEWAHAPPHSSPEMLDRADRFMAAFIDAVHGFWGGKVHAVVLNASCGHFSEDVADYFPRTLAKLQECDRCLLGLHEYDHPSSDMKGSGEGWLCGKFLRNLAGLKQKGYDKVRIAITECGVDSGVGAPTGSGHVGFKMWGDFASVRYLNERNLGWYIPLAQETDGVAWLTLFGCGMHGDWASFDIRNTPVIDGIGEIYSNWTPPEPEPPKPNGGKQMDIRVFNIEGEELFGEDAADLIRYHGITVHEPKGLRQGEYYWAVVILREAEGPACTIVTGLLEDGSLAVGQELAWAWTDDMGDADEIGGDNYPTDWQAEADLGYLNEKANIGLAFGQHGWYHDPYKPGPGRLWIRDKLRWSVLLTGIGMEGMTNHRTMYPTHQIQQWAGGGPEPPPTDGKLDEILAVVMGNQSLLEEIKAMLEDGYVPPGPEPETFRGEYFANRHLQGTPAFVRGDLVIDFDWGNGSPAASIPPDDFSIRWTGKRTFEAGTYRFHTLTDDGVRLWVDGVLLIDKWIDQAPKEWLSGPVTLTAGQHDVRMEYYEHGGGAVAKLWWEKL